MYYIGLDVHKKTISYCVKEANGHIHAEGKVGATRYELDDWMKTLRNSSRGGGVCQHHGEPLAHLRENVGGDALGRGGASACFRCG